jgi:hypothetical protein
MCWPETATHNDGIGIFQRDGESLDNTIKVVPHFELQVRCDTHGSKLLTDVRRIGVHNLPKKQFGSDSNNIAPHANIAAF